MAGGSYSAAISRQWWQFRRRSVLQRSRLPQLQEQAYDGALADFNQVIKLNPKFAEAYTNRGLIFRPSFDGATIIVQSMIIAGALVYAL